MSFAYLKLLNYEVIQSIRNHVIKNLTYIHSVLCASIPMLFA